jgi:hypothetical protein
MYKLCEQTQCNGCIINAWLENTSLIIQNCNTVQQFNIFLGYTITVLAFALRRFGSYPGLARVYVQLQIPFCFQYVWNRD